MDYTTNRKIVGILVRDAEGAEFKVYSTEQTSKAPIHAPEDAITSLTRTHPNLFTEKREHFVCLYLDTRRRLLETRVLSVGTLEASLVHPREVLGPALELRASSILVAHNHPSGDAAPSSEDCALTKRLDKACHLMGIKLVDHIIVAGADFVSLRQEGMF